MIVGEEVASSQPSSLALVFLVATFKVLFLMKFLREIVYNKRTDCFERKEEKKEET